MSLAAAAQEQQSRPPASATAATAASTGTARRAQQRTAASLDERIAAYTRILDLTPNQQSQLRAVLVQQRIQMRRLWNDNAIPAAERVLGTRAIGDATADRIRSMLNEDQLKKYSAPRAGRDTAQTAGEPISVEQWMSAVSAH